MTLHSIVGLNCMKYNSPSALVFLEKHPGNLENLTVKYIVKMSLKTGKNMAKVLKFDYHVFFFSPEPPHIRICIS